MHIGNIRIFGILNASIFHIFHLHNAFEVHYFRELLLISSGTYNCIINAFYEYYIYIQQILIKNKNQ